MMRPIRDRSVRQLRNEFSVCSVAVWSGPATRVTVTSASRGAATRLPTCTSGYDDAASIIVGTLKSRLPVIRCRAPSGMLGWASRRRHSVNASAWLPTQDAHTARSSVAR
jgi:hypothetical protein